MKRHRLWINFGVGTISAELSFLADEPHGTLANGGPFESCYVAIMLYGPDGIVGAELFEIEHLDAAKARFAELRAAMALFLFG